MIEFQVLETSMVGLRYAVFGIAFMLSACGSTTEERGLSGAGMGAAAGAAIGAVTGLSIVEGVVIGAAAGGLTGVLTDEETMCGRLPVGKVCFEVCASWSGAVMCPAC